MWDVEAGRTDVNQRVHWIGKIGTACVCTVKASTRLTTIRVACGGATQQTWTCSLSDDGVCVGPGWLDELVNWGRWYADILSTLFRPSPVLGARVGSTQLTALLTGVVETFDTEYQKSIAHPCQVRCNTVCQNDEANRLLIRVLRGTVMQDHVQSKRFKDLSKWNPSHFRKAWDQKDHVYFAEQKYNHYNVCLIWTNASKENRYLVYRIKPLCQHAFCKWRIFSSVSRLRPLRWDSDLEVVRCKF